MNSFGFALEAIDNSFIARAMIVSFLFVFVSYFLVVIIGRASVLFRIGDTKVGVSIDSNRRAYELEVIKANRKLVSSSERFEDVNHLLLDPRLDTSGSSVLDFESGKNNSFYHSLGVDFNTLEPRAGNVFVLTPFHPEHDETYNTIRAVLSDLNYDVSRGDNLIESGSILKHIVETIAQSELVVANIDGRNPNVYYELGIAQAMGKTVLLLSSEVESVPIDFKTQRLIVWNSRTELENGLLRVFAKIGKAKK